jgi:hypothetical protein
MMSVVLQEGDTAQPCTHMSASPMSDDSVLRGHPCKRRKVVATDQQENSSPCSPRRFIIRAAASVKRADVLSFGDTHYSGTSEFQARSPLEHHHANDDMFLDGSPDAIVPSSLHATPPAVAPIPEFRRRCAGATAAAIQPPEFAPLSPSWKLPTGSLIFAHTDGGIDGEQRIGGPEVGVVASSFQVPQLNVSPAPTLSALDVARTLRRLQQSGAHVHSGTNISASIISEASLHESRSRGVRVPPKPTRKPPATTTSRLASPDFI